MAIVDGLEVIKIHHGHGEKNPFSSGTGELSLDNIPKLGTIQKAGQWIMGSGVRQDFAGGDELILEVNDTSARPQAHLQFLRVERLGDVVVRTGLQAFDNVLLLSPYCQQEHIHVPFSGLFPYLPADGDPVHFRHDPIENGHLGRIFALKHLPCFNPVFGRDHVISPIAEHGLDFTSRDGVIFCYHNLHGPPSSIRRSNTRSKGCNSFSSAAQASVAWLKSPLSPAVSNS